MKNTLLFCVSLFFASALVAQSNRGLVVYYPLSGNTSDASGFNNNGYRGSGTVLTTDIAGNANEAYSYDGTSGATIDAFASATLNTGNMTNLVMSVWIKPGSGSTGFPEATIATLVTASTKTHYALVYSTADNKIVFRNFNGPSLSVAATLTSTVVCARDVWHHVAVKIDSLDNISLFVNGVVDGSIVATPVKPVGNTLTVGRNPIAPVANNLSFLGVIDEVRVYDGYMTDAEIKDNFYTPHYCYGYRSASSQTISACYSYTVPSGHETYTTGGSYTDTIPNSFGCDSIITINLTINTIDTAITVSGDSLTANETGATYKWLDCNNNFAAIATMTNQSFTPLVNGNYAVEISKNGCTDTSNCYQIVGLGMNEPFGNANILVYPNPATTELNVVTTPDFGKNIHITLFTILGKQVLEVESAQQNSHYTISLDGLTPGVYFLQVKSENSSGIQKVFVGR